MSYILDALKKSEKERRHGTVPDLLTVQDILVQEPKKRLLWPYFLLIALLLNAGLFMWWLNPWQSKKPKVVVQSADRQHQEPAKTINPGIRAAEEKRTPKLTAPAKPSANPVKIVRED